MGRRQQRATRDPKVDAEAVLAGREDISGDGLFRLIHRVNPTPRELAAAEQERRYSQKSRLQSLLVRRFPELVVVVATGDGVVSLRHRSGLQDACHAVVDELEPDARAWVRRQLDLAATPMADDDPVTVPAPSPGEQETHHASASADELVARAQDALRDYEYDVAEDCLVEAVATSHGAVEAALPLVELRVELLGMDEEAFDLWPRLDTRAREHPRIRSLLALAAARLDRTEHALKLVKGLEASLAAEAYAELVRGAARRREREAAAGFLAELELLDPNHAGLDGLRQALAELAASDFGPAEDGLEQRFASLGAPAVEAEARALLERWPESRIARQVLREVAVEKRRHTVASQLEAGEQALAAERFRDAERHFQKARDAGAEHPDLENLLATARRRAEHAETEEKIGAVIETLDADERAACLAYLALPAALREEVRERVDLPALGRLEEVGAPSSGGRARTAVAAVLALAKAEKAWADDDPRAALDQLESHPKVLAQLADARRMREDIECRLTEERRGEARSALAAAAAAAGKEALDELARRLDEVDLDVLDEAERARHAALRERLAQAETRVHLEAELERHLADRDLLTARPLARKLMLEAPDEAARRQWRERHEELAREVRKTFRVEVDRHERPLSDLRHFHPSVEFERSEVWLDDEGVEMVVVETRSGWLFIQVVDVVRGRVVERVSMEAPGFQGPITVCRDSDVVRIVDDHGAFLEVERQNWEPLRLATLGEQLPTSESPECLELLPGTSYIWMESEDRYAPLMEQRAVCRVLDLETLSTRRRIASPYKRLVHGPRGPVMQLGDGRLRTADGKAIASRHFDPIPAALVQVDDDLFLTGRAEPEEKALILQLRGPKGVLVGTDLRVEPCDTDCSKILAYSSAQELAFLLCYSSVGEASLQAFRVSPQGLTELYRMPFSWGATLAHDRWSRHVVAVYLDQHHLRAVPLGAEPPPRIDPRQVAVGPGLPVFQGPFACEVTGSRSMHPFGEDLRYDALPEMVRKEEDPYPYVAKMLAMRMIREERAAELEDQFREMPTMHAARYGLAVLAADHQRWDEVYEGLSAIDPARIPCELPRHYYHLLGISHMDRGEWREARAAFARGGEQGGCDFALYLELLDLLEKGEPAPEKVSSDLAQVYEALHAAERALTAGDSSASLAALDRPAAWRLDEVQSAARRAAIWLDREASTPGQIFDKRLALIFFYEAHRIPGGRLSSPDQGGWRVKIPGCQRHSLDVLPFTWDEKRIDELANASFQWLAPPPSQDER